MNSSLGSMECFFILEDLYEYRIKFANQGFLKLLGYSSVDKLTDLLSLKEQRDLVAVTLSKKQCFDFRCVLLANDNRYVGALLKFSIIGSTIYCHVEDYENDMDYIKRLEFENDRLSALVELTGSMLAEFDSSGRLTFASSSVINAFNIKLFEGGLVSVLGHDMVLKEDIDNLVSFIRQPFEEDSVKTCEVRLLSNDTYKWFKLTAKGIPNPRGELTRVLLKIEDIEVYKAHESVLQMKVDRDDLTFCYKKSFLLETLKGIKVKGCLAFFDIDNFKGINDTYGHLNGDFALKSVAKICKEVFCCEGDIVCRFGGDEFCIYSRCSNKGTFEHKIQQLQSRVCKVKIDADNPLSLSVGMVEASDTLDNIQTLLDVADTTLYIVKENGKNSYKFFDDLK